VLTAGGAFEVRLAGGGEHFMCAADESVLRAMLRLGRRGIPVGCTNGGCGICKVRIVEGRVRRLGPVSRAQVGADEEAAGLTLACRVAPDTALVIQPMGYLESRFSRRSPGSRGCAIQSINGDE
jgi:3-phenylpropionate/trans-cinnamate dioxygenase ferredoxin reductase subunit